MHVLTASAVTYQETADLLDEAAAHVRKTGLWKETYWPVGPSARNRLPACSIGHFQVVAGVWRQMCGHNDPRVQAMTEALAREICGEYFDKVAQLRSALEIVSQWNDQADRSAKEVAEAMEEAARRLRSSN